MMVELKRMNKMGLGYTLRGELTGNETVIHCANGKSLMVKRNISEMNQGWFNWVRKNQFVQVAFAFLDAGEREFLMTGILPAEFDELMKDVES